MPFSSSMSGAWMAVVAEFDSGHKGSDGQS